MKSRAISTNGSITRCSEQEVAMMSPSSDFSKLLIHSTRNYSLPKNSSGQLFVTPDRLLAEINMETPTNRRFLQEIYLILFFFTTLLV